MDIKTFRRPTHTTSKISTVIIFLALIRALSEPFRLQYYSATILTYSDIKPFLIGSLVAATGLLAMTILFYLGKHTIILLICLLTIILMLVVKKVYLLP
jgi:hypothetical protein